MTVPSTDQLIAYLRSQRAHVFGVLEGLEEADLRRPVLPSGWTCLGLVNHLAVDVERFWFRAVVAGESAVVQEFEGSQEDGWHVSPTEWAATVFDRYRDEARRSDSIIEGSSLDGLPAWWPADLFGDSQPDDVADILLHVIVETATHAGHLDAARELIDGRTWRVLP